MNIFKLSVAFMASTTLLGAIASLPAQAQIASWQKQLGTTKIDAARSVATDVNGNAYVAGITNGNLVGINQGNFDIFLAKYDSNGATLWKRQLGTTAREDVYDVATDPNGNVYVTGETDGSLGALEQGLDDIFLVKYNSNGTLLWKRQIGTNGVDSPRSVATDVNGNVYIAGATTGDLASPNQGGVDAFVAKYNSNGILLWKKQLGTNKIEGASAVAVDANGNVYISGSTFISFQLDSDAWIAKYNSVGAVVWKKQIAVNQNDDHSDLAIAPDGSIYMSSSTATNFASQNQGSYDAWLARLTNNGTVLWKKQLGTVEEDKASSVAVDKNGLVYISGTTKGSLGGSNAGKEDAWIAKYNYFGTPLWKKQLGTGSRDFSNGLAIGINNSLYVSGSTEGSLGGVNQGSADAWIAKYSGI